MHVLGRETDAAAGPVARIGTFLARDGSRGAPVAVDVDGPHAAVLVGKRGTGKSHTLGVLAEELGEAPGVAPVVLDPMSAFGGLEEAPGGRVLDARVRVGAVPPSAWPDLLGLDPVEPAGSLVWRVAADLRDVEGATSVRALREAVAAADAPAAARRAADNHLALAATWDVFDADAPPLPGVADGGPTVVDCAGLSPAALGAVGRAVARGLYEARVTETSRRLPWLLVDEAHAFFEGVAEPAFRTLFTRGRAPGVSLVCATQRPSALPDVAVSQADLLIAHRLTAERDVDALRAAQPTYLGDDLGTAVPTGVGEALVVDDVTETATTVAVRERRTTHGGDDPSASAVSTASRARTALAEGSSIRSDRSANADRSK